MKFINRGEPIKIRVGNFNENFYWITLKKGETMELSEEAGRNNKLEEVKSTEGQIGNVKVETKQIENNSEEFYRELVAINGIGKKTAKDIVSWGTKEGLIEAIKNKKNLPFREDVDKLLEERYG